MSTESVPTQHSICCFAEMLDSLYTITDFTQPAVDLDTTKSVTYLNLDLHHQDYAQWEPDSQISNYELPNVDYGISVHEDTRPSSVEYIFSLSDTEDLLDIIKCESSNNSCESVGNTTVDSVQCKPNSQTEQCLRYSTSDDNGHQLRKTNAKSTSTKCK